MSFPARRRQSWAIWVSALLGLVVGAVGAGFVAQRLARQAVHEEIAELGRSLVGPQLTNQPLPARLQASPLPDTAAFIQASANSVASVVYISIETGGAQSWLFGGGGPSSGGSGVIVTKSGFILTNNHVVEGANSIQVTLHDKRAYPAELIATDPNTDLAVIQINATDLQPMQFGNSDQLRVGQWVLAVGNPFNLASTVTTGIVSAKARNIGLMRQSLQRRRDAAYTIESFIQTDAAVNPGNSGGALVNLRGELVGINTAIASETGAFEGYSFAVPSNLARKVAEDLITYGAVQRGFVGVSIQDVNAQLVESENLEVQRGAYVVQVLEDRAASQAGIQVGDVIVSLEGAPVLSASMLQEEVASYRPGDQVELTLVRKADTLRKSLTLLNKSGGRDLMLPNLEHTPLQLDKWGASLIQPSDMELRARDETAGVKVLNVKRGGPFARAGVQAGFLIQRINNRQVNTPQKADELIRQNAQLKIEGVDLVGKQRSFQVDLYSKKPS